MTEQTTWNIPTPAIPGFDLDGRVGVAQGDDTALGASGAGRTAGAAWGSEANDLGVGIRGTGADTAGAAAASQPFIEGNVITGRVVHVDKDVVAVNSTLGKLAACIVDGSPIQFGHSTVSYTLEVEPCAAQPSGRQESRCLLFYGDVKSQVQVGHVIEARVKLVRGKLLVKRLNDLTTRTTVTPAVQIGGSGLLCWLGRAAVAALVLLLITLLVSIANGTFFDGLAALASGLLNGVLGVVGVLLATFAPLLIALAVIYFLVKGSFR